MPPLLRTLHATDPVRLGRVIAAMRLLGAPTVPVVDCGTYWLALGYTHRLAAACVLGDAPVFGVVAPDALVVGELAAWAGLSAGPHTVREVVEAARASAGARYRVGEDGRLTALG